MPDVIACVIVTARWSPGLSMMSCSPRTVTVWAVPQLPDVPAVNSSSTDDPHVEPPSSLTCVPAGAVAVIVTLPSGCVASTTV